MYLQHEILTRQEADDDQRDESLVLAQRMYTHVDTDEQEGKNQTNQANCYHCLHSVEPIYNHNKLYVNRD